MAKETTDRQEIEKAIEEKFKNMCAGEKARLIKDLTNEFVKIERNRIHDEIIKAMKKEKYLFGVVKDIKSGKKTVGKKRTIEIDGWTCEQTIKTSEGKGKNNRFNCYKWITVECTCSKGEEYFQSNYSIWMNYHLFDMKTGNAHVLIDGKIQIWKNLIPHSGSENGGSIRLPGIGVGLGDINMGEKTYKFYHAPANAYPKATTEGYKSIEWPWGFTKEQIEVEEIPVMDMAEPGYDPEKLGVFFNKLIKADLKRKFEEWERVICHTKQTHRRAVEVIYDLSNGGYTRGQGRVYGDSEFLRGVRDYEG